MKDNRNIFDDMDDNAVSMISEYFPVLNNKEKDRIFAMSERKSNISTSEADINNEDVNEVEEYSRPVWHRYLGMAAAFVIVAAGIGGGGYLMHSMKKTAPNRNDSELATEATTITTQTTANETVLTTTTTNNNVETVTSIVTVFTDMSNTDVVTEEDSNSYNNTSTETTVNPTTQDTSESDNNEELSAIADEVLEQYPEIVKIEIGTYYSDNNDTIKFKYQFDDNEVTYYHIDPNVFPDMDSLKSYYYSMVLTDSGNTELFGPEYTSDELPEGSMLSNNRLFIYITYDGKLYGTQNTSDITKFNLWSSEPASVNNIVYDGSEPIEFAARKSHTMFNFETSALDTVYMEFRLSKDRSSGKWMIESYNYVY